MDTKKTLGLAIVMAVGMSLLWTGPATAACSPELKERAPEQVLADHRAALAAQDWDAARCNFHPDAKMISDSGVSEGVDAIIAEFQQLATFFGGYLPAVYSEIVLSILDSDRYMARVLYFFDTPCVDVGDGADTYIIRKGQIVALTTHGFASFSC
jgi:hypothetical protein